jgi:hypothetical protein
MYEFMSNQILGISGLINLSNIVFLVAFSIRDVLRLRILAIIGEGLTLPYYYFQDEKLWPPIIWGVAFMIVNAIRAALTSRAPKTDSGNTPAFGAPEHRADHRKCHSVLKTRPNALRGLSGWLVCFWHQPDQPGRSDDVLCGWLPRCKR